MLTLHVFGATGSDGTRGAGAYTLDIDVLPQVVSVEAQTLLPGQGGLPGGPTASLVVTLQGDRLDTATAEDPANYRVTWLGPDGRPGTADDQVIPSPARRLPERRLRPQRQPRRLQRQAVIRPRCGRRSRCSSPAPCRPARTR